MSLILKGEQFFEGNDHLFLNREIEGFTTAMHSHDFIEISLVTQGKGIQYIENDVLEVQQGDLFLIPVGTSHVYRPLSPDRSEPLVTLNFIFDACSVTELQGHMPRANELLRLLDSQRLTEPTWIHYYDRREQFLSLFSQSYSEYSERPEGYLTMLKALLLQILHLLMRAASAPKAHLLQSEQPLHPIDDAFQYIEQCYAEKITLKEAATRSYMSVGHFQNQFKKATGVTFNHYVQGVRIQKCCHLLRTTDMSVQQSANEVGYNDMKFFYGLFRKMTGSSPQQYRKA